MAEQLANFAYTTVTGGYTAGSGVLNVASTSTGSGIQPFPLSGTFDVSISDHTTTPPTPKALLEVTAINSGTQFAVTNSGGVDVNMNAGDIVQIVMTVRSLTAYLQGTWTPLVGLYANGWTDFGSGYQVGQYSKDGTGRVWIRGVLAAGTLTAGTTILTLPSGFRPATLIAVSVVGAPASGTAYNVAQVDIQPGGAVVQQTNAANFAAAGAWLFNFSFSVN